ncbi:ExbD/TolR family protein [Marinicella sp. W31]|uniref:ExbD/TolR family protein n=1 Tax=Marinicella sp. W31 TaxID=3023713 RepID=UPI00375824DD
MKILNNDSQRPSLNLTPLIDVVFLLLIFFMVTTTFEKQAKLKIELPEAEIKPVASQTENLTISLSKNGEMFINNTQLPNNQRQSIVNALQNVANEDREMQVIIRADANVAHKFVVRIMDVLGSMGFSKVSMATTETTSDS